MPARKKTSEKEKSVVLVDEVDNDFDHSVFLLGAAFSYHQCIFLGMCKIYTCGVTLEDATYKNDPTISKKETVGLFVKVSLLVNVGMDCF